MGSRLRTVSYEEAMKEIGGFGRYQKLIFYLGSLFAAGGCVCSFSYVFVAALPDHWCHVPKLEEKNWTQAEIKALAIPPPADEPGRNYSRCSMYAFAYDNLTLVLSDSRNISPVTVECQHGWSYDTSQYRTSISMEWDLTCRHRLLAAASQSVYMAGLMVGVLMFGFIADSIGRRKCIVVCALINATSFILTALSLNYWMYICLRFTTALSEMSLFTIFMVLIMETVSLEWRAFVGVVTEYFWVFGYFLVGFCAYFIRTWRYLQLALSLPLLVYLPVIVFMPESPRWLYTKGRREEADALMAKIGRVNKMPLPEDIYIKVEEDSSNVYIWEACRYPKLRIRTAIIYFIWFTSSVVYYGLSLNSTNLGGNVYLSFILAGAIEIPAYMFCNAFSDRLGRRFVTSFTLLLSGIALLFTLAVPEGYYWPLVILSTCGKFGASAVFGIIYPYTVELFPTVARSTGIGSSSFFARIAGVMAPQMALLGEISKYIPMVTFGVLSLVAGALTFALPETAGATMPETMQDAEDFVNERARFPCGIAKEEKSEEKNPEQLANLLT